jgi:hypothetical protein
MNPLFLSALLAMATLAATAAAAEPIAFTGTGGIARLADGRLAVTGLSGTSAAVALVDTSTGALTILSQGGTFETSALTAIATARDGTIYVSELSDRGQAGQPLPLGSQQLVAIDPDGTRRVVAALSTITGLQPLSDLAVALDGPIFATTPEAVISIDPDTGSVATVLQRMGAYRAFTGVDVADDGSAIVAGCKPLSTPCDSGELFALPPGGAASMLTEHEHLTRPIGVSVLGGVAIVLAQNALQGESIVGVDLTTGAQTLLFSGDIVPAAGGIVAAPDGFWFVGTAAGIVKIDQVTGTETLLPYRQPANVPEPSAAALVAIALAGAMARYRRGKSRRARTL